MEEMLEEPSSEDVDGTLRQATLRPPRLLLHHPHRLVVRPLLPEALLQHLQPGRLSFRQTGAPAAAAVLLAEDLAAVPQLGGYRVLQAPEVPRHGLLGQGGVRDGGAETHHQVEGVHHHLHLLAVMAVSPINLKKQIMKIGKLNSSTPI